MTQTTQMPPTLYDRLRDGCRVAELVFHTCFWVTIAWISLDTTRQLATGTSPEIIGQHSFAAAAFLCSLLAAKNVFRSASVWGIFEQVWQQEDQTIRVISRPARRPLISAAVGVGAAVILFVAARAPAMSNSASGLPSGGADGYNAIGFAAMLVILCGLRALLYYGLAPTQELPIRSETIEEARNTALIFLVAAAWPFLPLAIFALVSFELILILLPREDSLLGGLISFVTAPVCAVLALAAAGALPGLLSPIGTTAALYIATAGIAYIALIHAHATVRALKWTPRYR